MNGLQINSDRLVRISILEIIKSIVLSIFSFYEDISKHYWHENMAICSDYKQNVPQLVESNYCIGKCNCSIIMIIEKRAS